MAKGNGNILLQNIRGRIGKELVIKQYANGIVIAKYPRIPSRKRKVLPPLKRLCENRFADAVKFAQGILRNHDLRVQYEGRQAPGQTLYHYLISNYMDERLRIESPLTAQMRSKQDRSFTEVLAKIQGSPNEA